MYQQKCQKYVFKDFILSLCGFFTSELKRILKDDPNVDEDDITFEFEDWINIKWEKQVLTINASGLYEGKSKNNDET